MEILSIFFAVIAGGCLAIIQLRMHFKYKVPLVGGLLSKEVRQPMEQMDKVLAITALVSFLICLFFVAITYW